MDEKDEKTIEFIKKAKIRHGEKYNYDKTIYTGALNKVIITCQVHGDFEVCANSHLKYDCQKCKTDAKKLTFEQFKERANEKHKFKYDYSQANYVNTTKKITIICKEHGAFEQEPSKHINRGDGCKKCGVSKNANSQKGKKKGKAKIYNTKTFIYEARKIHGRRYSYKKTKYVHNRQKIKIFCKECKTEFMRRPTDHITLKSGCGTCNNKRKYQKKAKKTLYKFIKKAIEIHGNIYLYSFVKYINKDVAVDIYCKEHGFFSQTPRSHLQGHACKKCGDWYYNTQKWITEAKKTHGNKYDYSKVKYINSKTKVTIICKNGHGEFEQNPLFHVNGSNCPKCINKGYSKEAIKWLDFIAEKNDIKIQHAGNGGEFKIPGTKYSADGYCKKTNTILEYFGCIFHGCLHCYDANKYNPITGKLNQEMYDKSFERLKKIKNLGYNVIYIWGHQWEKFNKKVNLVTNNNLFEVYDNDIYD